MVKRHHLAFQPKATDPAKSSSTLEPPQNSKQTTKPPPASGSKNNTPPPSTDGDSSKNTKTNPPLSSTKSVDKSNTSIPPPTHPTSDKTSVPVPISKSTAPPDTKNSPSSKQVAAGGSIKQSTHPNSDKTSAPTPTSKPTAPPDTKSSSSSKSVAAGGSIKQSTHPSSSSSGTFTSSSNADSGLNSGKILGIDITTIIHIAIIAGVIALIIIILVILYRRYRTRVDYNESPQNFAHKPQLTFAQEYQLNHTKVKPLFNQSRVVIQKQLPVEGMIFKTQFKTSEKSAVYYKRLLKTVSYFQVQILNSNGLIEIGFLPKSSFEKFKQGNQVLSSTGVSITSSGFVQSQGQNIYNYSWNLAYGDVFGIGLTRETSKFSQRRAWVSKNGILLNSPPSDELDKWLATIQISAQQKNQYNLGTDKKGDGQQQEENQQAIKEKAKRQKFDSLLKKQRISLKTFNDFEYFAVVICHGNENDTKATVVNINVGGQVFRMFDTHFRAGLLKDKGFFGDD